MLPGQFGPQTKRTMSMKVGTKPITRDEGEASNLRIEESDVKQPTPKMKMLYENVLFVFEKRQVYLDKNINLAKLSQMLFTNTTYLSKVVNRFFGCNLKTLLNRYRVEYAKQLLRKEECNMEDLPARCGFISRSTFYAAFTRFEHATPTEYRDHALTDILRTGTEEF